MYQRYQWPYTTSISDILSQASVVYVYHRHQWPYTTCISGLLISLATRPYTTSTSGLIIPLPSVTLYYMHQCYVYTTGISDLLPHASGIFYHSHQWLYTTCIIDLIPQASVTLYHMHQWLIPQASVIYLYHVASAVSIYDRHQWFLYTTGISGQLITCGHIQVSVVYRHWPTINNPSFKSKPWHATVFISRIYTMSL